MSSESENIEIDRNNIRFYTTNLAFDLCRSKCKDVVSAPLMIIENSNENGRGDGGKQKD